MTAQWTFPLNLTQVFLVLSSNHGYLSMWLDDTYLLSLLQNRYVDYFKAFVFIGTGEISSLFYFVTIYSFSRPYAIFVCSLYMYLNNQDLNSKSLKLLQKYSHKPKKSISTKILNVGIGTVLRHKDIITYYITFLIRKICLMPSSVVFGAIYTFKHMFCIFRKNFLVPLRDVFWN